MGNLTHSSSKSQKSEQRRQQVLDASEKCFREKGFHGCSIASISREAGMSPGHIYYHFADKEAIVEALVERRQSALSKLLTAIENASEQTDLISVMLEQISDAIDRHTDLKHAQLILEIASESARNPRIANILTHSEQQAQEKIKAVFAKRFPEIDAAQIQAHIDLISALISGLTLRAPLDTHIDKTALLNLIKNIMPVVFQNTSA